MSVNLIAVLLASLAAMVVGALWYGPFFGRAWMVGMGWNPDDHELMAKMKKSAGKAYGQMFILVLLQAYVLAHILYVFSRAFPEITGLSAGIQGGFFMWLGFVLPIKYGDKLWGSKALKYVAIDLAYYLVVLIVMATIISMW